MQSWPSRACAQAGNAGKPQWKRPQQLQYTHSSHHVCAPTMPVYVQSGHETMKRALEASLECQSRKRIFKHRFLPGADEASEGIIVP